MSAAPVIPFAAVIFDCDGVLVASERLVNAIEARLVGGLGLVWSADEGRARFKGHTIDEVAALLEAETGTRLSPAWAYDWGMETALGFVRDLRPVPGVRDVLDQLGRAGMPMAAASQAPRARIELALAVTGLAAHFDGRVVPAAVVPRPKPAPDVFLLAAARLGADPPRCAVVEDSPSGVRAGVAAGMTVFGYAGDEDRAALVAAGAIAFDDMAALPQLLAAGRTAPMPPPSGHADRLRAAYAGLAAGDVTPLVAFLADDALYHLPGNHLGGGTLRGRAAILERLAHATAGCETRPVAELRTVVAGGEFLLSTERLCARRRGRQLDQEVCVVWRMAGTGCAEIRARFADQQACDRFWEG